MSMFGVRTIVYMCIVGALLIVFYAQIGERMKNGVVQGLPPGSVARTKEIAISRTGNTHNQELQSDTNFSDASPNLYESRSQAGFKTTEKEDSKSKKEDLEFDKKESNSNINTLVDHWYKYNKSDIGSLDIGVGITSAPAPQMPETLSTGNGFQEPNGESTAQMQKMLSAGNGIQKPNKESIDAFDSANGDLSRVEITVVKSEDSDLQDSEHSVRSRAEEGSGYPEYDEDDNNEGSGSSDEYYDDDYEGSGIDAYTNSSAIGVLIDDYEAEDADDEDEDGTDDDDAVDDTQRETEEDLMKRLTERFKSRRQTAEKGCRTHNNPVYSISRTKRRFLYYSYKYNLVVCAVAKTGASTWKSHLLAMKGISTKGINVHSGYYERKIRARSILGRSGLTTMLPKAAKVLTVRHPLDRLVSAYRDKFNGGKPQIHPPSKNFRYFWRPAIRRLRKSLKTSGKYQISFVDFLKQVVLDHWSGLSNAHWSKMYETCSPCQLHYDYIMKTETYSEDLAYIVKTLGIKEVDASYRRHGLASLSTQSTLTSDHTPLRSSTLKYYKDIPVSIMDKLEKIYSRDMDIFGYEFPNDIMNTINDYRAKNS